MKQLNDFQSQSRGEQITISDTRQDSILLQIKEVVPHHLMQTVHLI